MDPLTGGPCQGLRNTIPILTKSGIYSEVVCMDNPDSDYLGKDDFKINALGPGKTPWLYSNRLIPWLIENLHRFDVVIVNGLWQFHSYAIQTVLNKLGSRKGIATGKKIPKVYVMPH
ncbi:MAG: glycosyl transferase family 1, partial [Sphingobacteriaceae bacterium]